MTLFFFAVVFDFFLFAIPLISGLIGWITNGLAIKMLFSPIKRLGWKYFGWQGVLPANAKRMATTCVQLMTTQLLDVKALFERLDSDRIASLLQPGLERHAERLIEEALAHKFPKVWRLLPEKAKKAARSRLRKEIPSIVQKLMNELGSDLEEYLDIEKLVVEAFVNNRILLNELFWKCGRSEFRFIIFSGLIFGGLFGVVQMIVWMFVQPSWFLPVTGLFVGWATNWIALKMVFEPLEPKKIGPFVWQGLFLRRQPEVSEEYGEFFAKKILHPQALIRAVLQGAAALRVLQLLKQYIDEAVDSASGSAQPFIELVVGSKEWNDLKGFVSVRLVAAIPQELDKIYEYAGEALDIENELSRNLKALSSPDFEQVLRPLFKEDESTLIAVGAVLGGIAGLLQWLFMSYISGGV